MLNACTAYTRYPAYNLLADQCAKHNVGLQPMPPFGVGALLVVLMVVAAGVECFVNNLQYLLTSWHAPPMTPNAKRAKHNQCGSSAK